MSGQVQYPSDYVGADGKWYPTVGEAFRKGTKLPEYVESASILQNVFEKLNKYYNDIIVDYVKITATGNPIAIKLVSELSLNYTTAPHWISCNSYPILGRILLNCSLPSDKANIYTYSGAMKSSNFKPYLVGDTLEDGSTVELLVFLGVKK